MKLIPVGAYLLVLAVIVAATTVLGSLAARVFFSPGSPAFVLGGLFLVLTVYRPREVALAFRHPFSLTHGAKFASSELTRSSAVLGLLENLAVSFGWLGATIGAIQVFTHPTSTEVLLEGLAYSLAPLLWGYLIASIVFRPLGARVDRTAAERRSPVRE